MLENIIANYVGATDFLNKLNRLFVRELSLNSAVNNYLFVERRFSRAAIAEFQIGLAPSMQKIVEFVDMNSLNRDYLFELGIAFNDNEGYTYGRLERRVTFPITDISGNIIAFSGRLWAIDHPGQKYVNTSTSKIFRKSLALYGISNALSAVKKRDFVFLVEGNFDVIRMYESGIKNVVAPCGTAVTQEQLFLLTYLTRRVVTCFDGDLAGRAAATRISNLIKDLPVQHTTLSLPDGEDPDSYIHKYGGQAILTHLKQVWSIDNE